jgi:hypothetical protein
MTGNATSKRVCPSDVTLRDEEHRFVRCERPAGHTGSHHGQDVWWTDHLTVAPDDDGDLGVPTEQDIARGDQLAEEYGW